jgi:uncharacterized protein (TIGR02145 family)
MKKLLLLSAFLIFACSSDDEGNPCIYEPTLSTEAVTDITETSATLNGVISIVSENCEVALGEMQGFVYSTNPSPTNNDNVVVVYGTDISTTIDNLIPNTTYYVRVFITNSLGEFYGNEMDFTTNQVSLINCDGNPVPTIIYGTQEWTVENACHITYRDGTPIPQVVNSWDWRGLNTGAWCYYDNNINNGVSYNWHAVMGIHDAASLSNPSLRKEFAPDGWHVPSDAEWTTLEEYLIANGYNYDETTEGNKIAKAISSQSGWLSNSTTDFGNPAYNQENTNNSSGFNIPPTGYRATSTSMFDFQWQGLTADVWTSTEHSDGLAFYRNLDRNEVSINRYYALLRHGYSVRLVKD